MKPLNHKTVMQIARTGTLVLRPNHGSSSVSSSIREAMAKLYKWVVRCLLRNTNHRLPPLFPFPFCRIHLKGFSGTAGKISSIGQPGSDFSTKDADNDKCVCKCSQLTTGGKKHFNLCSWIFVLVMKMQISGFESNKFPPTRKSKHLPQTSSRAF